MPSYYVGNIPVGGNDIFHYGVKGMRWGVVNEIKEKIGWNARRDYAHDRDRLIGSRRSDDYHRQVGKTSARNALTARNNAREAYSKGHAESDKAIGLRKRASSAKNAGFFPRMYMLYGSGGEQNAMKKGQLTGGNVSPDRVSKSLQAIAKAQHAGAIRTYKMYTNMAEDAERRRDDFYNQGRSLDEQADRDQANARSEAGYVRSLEPIDRRLYEFARESKEKYEKTPLGKLEKAYKRQITYGKSFITKLRLNRVNRKKGGKK